jgi:hypothetical protein
MQAMMPMGVQPQQQSSGMGVGVIVLIVVGIFVLLGGCVGVGAFLMVRSAADDSYSSPRYSPPSGGGGGSGGGSSKSATPAIGDEVEFDDSTWTVIDARDMGKTIKATSELFAGETKVASGRFIQIHYKVTNDGKKQQTLLDTPKLVDSKSREFGAIQGESEYVPKGTKTAILETLQPSMERDFYTIIEVPADAHDLQIQIIELGLGSDKKLVDTDL